MIMNSNCVTKINMPINLFLTDNVSIHNFFLVSKKQINKERYNVSTSISLMFTQPKHPFQDFISQKFGEIRHCNDTDYFFS